VRVNALANVWITVSADIDGTPRNMGRKEFRCKRVPDPEAMVAGMKGGVIDKNLLMAQTGVVAAMPPDFDFQLTFTVVSFNVTAVVGGYEQIQPSNSNMLTQQQKNLINGLRPGQKVYFEDVIARGPDGTNRNLGTLSFKLQ
jgi:hypothetical protein